MRQQNLPNFHGAYLATKMEKRLITYLLCLMPDDFTELSSSMFLLTH
jgi:hypothetical protein